MGSPARTDQATNTSRRYWPLLAAIVVLVPLLAVARRELVGADAPSWTTAVTLDRTDVAPGATIKLSATATAAVGSVALVDVEIHDAAGAKVTQQFWDDQSFTPGRPKVFDWSWDVPAGAVPGVYTVKVGIFDRGWGRLHHWNNSAARFSIAPDATVTTTTTSPTTTTTGPTTTTIPTTTTTGPTTTTTIPTTTTTGPTSTTTPASTTTRPPGTSSTTTPPTTTTPPGDAQFVEDFSTADGFYERFQTEVFHGVDPMTTPDGIRSWHGDHNTACDGPTTTRPVHVDQHDEMFWWCAPAGPDSGHVMTSMYTTGYAQVDFAPDQVFNDVHRVCWDQNQTELGGRKWVQVVVVPESLYQENGGRLAYVSPALQNDVGVGGFRLTGDAFMFVGLRGSTEVRVGQTGRDVNWAGFTTTDKARRFTTCLIDQDNGTMRIELERESSTEVRTLNGAFPDDDVRVIFSDDSYDPPKGDLGNAPTMATWHWDNVEIS